MTQSKNIIVALLMFVSTACGSAAPASAATDEPSSKDPVSCECSSVAGPQGPMGPQGAQGPAGAIGAAGAEGPQGPVGLTGAVGPQGPVGPAGANGSNGAPGAQGPQGAAGGQGPKGDTGTIDGSSIYVVSATTGVPVADPTVPGGSKLGINAACNAGDILLSGGCNLTLVDTTATGTIFANIPNTTATIWTCISTKVGTGSLQLTARAVCLAQN
jgi:hypothetical protein